MEDSVGHGIPEDRPVFPVQGSLQNEVGPRIDQAFGNTPFEPMSQDVEMLLDVIKSGSMRMKTTHDPKLGCDVLLVEYLGLSSEDASHDLQSHHVLIARWANGQQCFFNVEQSGVLGTEGAGSKADELNRWAADEMLRVMGLFTDNAS